MTRQRQIEILAAELAKSEQMDLENCQRWIERGFAAVDVEERKMAANDNINGTLRNAYRLNEGDPRCPCLVGYVYGDTKGRFRDGDRVTTSTIVSEEGDVFRTRYSVYRVESWRDFVQVAA
jgi:hypothetical protein